MGRQENAGRERFNTTRWSVVCRAGAAKSDESRQALGELFEAYWYSLYAFARRQGQADHDAMDSTQGFFASLIAGNDLTRVSREKGRFRSFLLASFKNFIANQRRAAGAIRRGGNVNTTSFTSVDFNSRYEREAVDHETPDALFQRSWVELLLQTVRKRLASDYETAGKSELFTLLEPHLIGGPDAVPRGDIGKQLKLSPAAVAMSLHRLRRRYGELLREEVAATVSDPDQVEDELKSLISIVGS